MKKINPNYELQPIVLCNTLHFCLLGIVFKIFNVDGIYNLKLLNKNDFS